MGPWNAFSLILWKNLIPTYNGPICLLSPPPFISLATTVENSMEFPQKIKDETAF